MNMKQSRGLSLIELVIYLGLTIILLGLLSGILITIVRVQTQQNVSQKVVSELNFVMSTIKTDIRQASGTMAITTTTLDLTTTQSIQYSYASNTLYRKVGSGPTEALNNSTIKVDDVIFKEFLSGSIQAAQVELTFSFNSTNPAQQEPQTIRSTTAPLR